MNALELADNLLKNGGNCSWFKEIATMLRQQQAEIEALKAGKIRAYDNGVEDGRKPNTHPVKELSNNHQYIAKLEMIVRNQQAEIEALKLQLHTTLANRDLRTYDGKAQEK